MGANDPSTRQLTRGYRNQSNPVGKEKEKLCIGCHRRILIKRLVQTSIQGWFLLTSRPIAHNLTVLGLIRRRKDYFDYIENENRHLRSIATAIRRHSKPWSLNVLVHLKYRHPGSLGISIALSSRKFRIHGFWQSE